jgi:hypothetical protein
LVTFDEFTIITEFPEIYAKFISTVNDTLPSYTGVIITEPLVEVLNLSPEIPVGPV